MLLTKGLDFAAILDYARTTGSPALRKMSQQRGLMLRALAMHPATTRISFITSVTNGATKADTAG